MTYQTNDLTRIVAVLVHRQVNFVVVGAWAIQAQNYELGDKDKRSLPLLQAQLAKRNKQ